VSYIGLEASLKDKETIDDTDYYFGIPTPVILNKSGDIQTEPTTYTLVGDDYPTLLWR
jgi:hypothetical protein